MKIAFSFLSLAMYFNLFFMKFYKYRLLIYNNKHMNLFFIWEVEGAAHFMTFFCSLCFVYWCFKKPSTLTIVEYFYAKVQLHFISFCIILLPTKSLHRMGILEMVMNFVEAADILNFFAGIKAFIFHV